MENVRKEIEELVLEDYQVPKLESSLLEDFDSEDVLFVAREMERWLMEMDTLEKNKKKKKMPFVGTSYSHGTFHEIYEFQNPFSKKKDSSK